MPPASRTRAGFAKPGPAAGGGLSTERVMAAALHIVDTEGLPALSMRRLAKAVDREAMTLYRYAESKTSLLDGITDLVLRELDVNPRAADWRQELRKLADDFRALALAHPNVVPLLLTRPLATPPGRRLPGTLRPLELLCVPKFEVDLEFSGGPSESGIVDVAVHVSVDGGQRGT